MQGYAIYNSTFGHIRIDYEDNAVIGLKRLAEAPTEFGRATDFSDRVFEEIADYFAGNRKSFSFPYTLRGTEFQKKVWAELEKIPYGETRTYKEIAINVGNEKASRAVGMANNKNPILLVVPCHRVIGASGKLVGYAGGMEMKERLIDMEGKNK